MCSMTLRLIDVSNGWRSISPHLWPQFDLGRLRFHIRGRGPKTAYPSTLTTHSLVDLKPLRRPWYSRSHIKGCRVRRSPPVTTSIVSQDVIKIQVHPLFEPNWMNLMSILVFIFEDCRARGKRPWFETRMFLVTPRPPLGYLYVYIPLERGPVVDGSTLLSLPCNDVHRSRFFRGVKTLRDSSITNIYFFGFCRLK